MIAKLQQKEPERIAEAPHPGGGDPVKVTGPQEQVNAPNDGASPAAAVEIMKPEPVTPSENIKEKVPDEKIGLKNNVNSGSGPEEPSGGEDAAGSSTTRRTSPAGKRDEPEDESGQHAPKGDLTVCT